MMPEQKTVSLENNSLTLWLKSRPYWEQTLWDLHLREEEINDKHIEDCLSLLLEDNKIIPAKLARPKITLISPNFLDNENSGNEYFIEKVDGFSNVNAIDASSVLELNQGLTVILGDNGSGKSGIGRLFSNACHSRKPRKLLGDARTGNTQSTIPGAVFHLLHDNVQDVVNYRLGDSFDVLREFSVFDKECAQVHLNSENRVEFVPAKIRIFDRVFDSVQRIERKLSELSVGRKIQKPYEGLFTISSPTRNFLDALNSNITDAQLTDAIEFAEKDELALRNAEKELAEKQKLDVTQQKNKLVEEQRILGAMMTRFVQGISLINSEQASRINAIIRDVKQKKEIAERIGAKNFDFEYFNAIGSQEWKSLILAAKRLYDKEAMSEGDVSAEYCLLCRKKLTKEDLTLFERYWEFLGSTAEAELEAARRSLMTQRQALEFAGVRWPTLLGEDNGARLLGEAGVDEIAKITRGLDALNRLRVDWIKCIDEETPNILEDIVTVDLGAIDRLVLGKNDEEKKLIDPASRIKELSTEISNLREKERASALLSRIKEYLEWLRFEAKSSQINLSAVRGAITKERSRVMSDAVISRYVDLFNNETARLKCDFDLEVVQRGRDGETVKGLRLKYTKSHAPGDILSEGEQTVASIADFLAEASLTNYSGLIFDDPVTSLDHGRMTHIANRLAEESKNRQVVVLTHDILFALELQECVNFHDAPGSFISIRKFGNKVGVINQELPWLFQDLSKRIGYLKNRLVRVKKQSVLDSEEYRNEVKIWYLLLREGWERAVEERLLNGSLTRFKRSIETSKLAKIHFDETLLSRVVKGMTTTSNWLHDLAPGVNPLVPKIDELEKDLAELESFATDCKPK